MGAGGCALLGIGDYCVELVGAIAWVVVVVVGDMRS